MRSIPLQFELEFSASAASAVGGDADIKAIEPAKSATFVRANEPNEIANSARCTASYDWATRL